MANLTEKQTRNLRNELPQQERRFVNTTLEMRMGESENTASTLFGYAAKFNTPTLLYQWSDEEWYEVIEPGFFDDVLSDDVRCLKNHDSNLVMGRTTANTLTLKSDATGLYFECTPDARISYAADTIYAVERGDISQCSFAFYTKEQKWTEEEKAGKLIVTRYLVKAKRLFDVGPVTYPAYPDTEVGTRSADDFRSSLEAWRKENRQTEETTQETQNSIASNLAATRRQTEMLRLRNH